MALSRVVLSLLKLKVSYSCQLELRKSIPKYFFNNNTRLISTAALIDKTKKMPFETVEAGTPNGDDFRIYYKNENGPVSPLHDIPLYADPANNVFNMVVEIPRWTNAKMEIDTKSPLNPIKQDVKNGKLRYVANCFPHHGYIWNYGAFPQTWENPAHVDSHTNHKGDNDPIDVLEIGHRVAKRGEIIQVKVLGTIALIDEGETDWKIFTIDVNDPQAQQMNDINDVEKFFPGLLKASVEWFKIYKIPDGKPENKFAFNGEAKNSEFALNIVRETHKFWNGLIKKELDGGKLSCSNVSIEGSPFKIGLDEANNILNQAPKPGTAKGIDSIVDKWHFLHLK
ncbi:inorganic pyrophosphatase [Nilaparvata lugens]|uniref:inorganic pyrophosphatase n=1 Tax=Nilaparvata lugens TaxID=108931 RepID=UPI00193E31A9|nr:inorganic pyrophosphatase [Nilaparvata lugens]